MCLCGFTDLCVCGTANFAAIKAFGDDESSSAWESVLPNRKSKFTSFGILFLTKSSLKVPTEVWMLLAQQNIFNKKATNKAACKECSTLVLFAWFTIWRLRLQTKQLKAFYKPPSESKSCFAEILNCMLFLWSSSISFYCLCLFKLSDAFS